jgi:hypothetical protein
MTSKKHGASASARQPKDAVPGDETVRVPQDFINGTEYTNIDFGLVTKLFWVGGRQLIKPSELAVLLLPSLIIISFVNQEFDFSQILWLADFHILFQVHSTLLHLFYRHQVGRLVPSSLTLYNLTSLTFQLF